MSTAIATDRLRTLIDAELESLVAIRHDLHAHPELGYEEHRTSGVIRRELEAAGIAHVGDLAGGTGVVGHLPGAGARAIGLRADIDALPILERTGLAYASTTPGRMHACGHDGHTTVLLGAARVLARLAAEGDLPRPVTFCFQPAEEGGGGGERMVDEGCLDGSIIGPPVEAMFGLHGWPLLAVGEAGSRPGPLLAAADMFEATITGVGGHAATPHLTRDPVLAAAATVQALQQIASRNADPCDAVVVSVTRIEGGTAHNIIPGAVRIAGTVRTVTEATRELARERLHAVIQGTSEVHGTRAEVTWRDGYPITINDPAAYRTAMAALQATLGEAGVQELPVPTMGGEDFSYYGRKVPAAFVFLGLRPAEQPIEATPLLHQDTFDFNDEAIAHGVAWFCRLALHEGSLA